MSSILSNRPKPTLRGKSRPQHSDFLKKWWGEHPEQRERARQRGIKNASDKKYLEMLSDLLSGEKNPNWRGGISNRKYKNFYQKLKDKIRKRDNFSCQLCKESESDLGHHLSIHHIDYDKENYLEINLIALCKRCNSLANFGEEKWINYFKRKIAIIYGNGLRETNIEDVKYAD